MDGSTGLAARHAGFDAGMRQAKEHTRMGTGMLVEPALQAEA